MHHPSEKKIHYWLPDFATKFLPPLRRATRKYIQGEAKNFLFVGGRDGARGYVLTVIRLVSSVLISSRLVFSLVFFSRLVSSRTGFKMSHPRSPSLMGYMVAKVEKQFIRSRASPAHLRGPPAHNLPRRSPAS
jgi:hypothetical protein